jgi:hypothetical protein
MGKKEKEDMRGKTLGRRGFLGREHHFERGEDCIVVLGGWSSLLEDGSGFCWRILLEFGGLRQGAPVAGSSGLGGQEFLWNPGARESERLCS